MDRSGHRNILRCLLDLILPRSCVACGAAPTPDTPLCNPCLAELTPALSPDAAGPLRVQALCRHAGPARELVHALKYGGRRDVARFFAARAAAVGMLPAGAVLVPIPLYARRERARGFNQSALLADAIVEAIPGLAVARALARRRPTRSQTQLDRAARQANVAGAFALREVAGAPLAGRHVILVDDVVTTGATLHAAAAALRGVNTAAIGALVAVRAELD
jgi:ComF family protein